MSEKPVPEMIKVNEVKEEYDYVQNQICLGCNTKGTLKVELQRLVTHGGNFCDELDCICGKCGHKITFVFDVSTVFEGYKQKFGPN